MASYRAKKWKALTSPKDDAFIDSDFTGADFTNFVPIGCKFVRCTFADNATRYFRFIHAEFEDCQFTRVDWRHAVLSNRYTKYEAFLDGQRAGAEVRYACA